MLTDPTRHTIGEYLNQWLGSSAALSPKTLERYRELAQRQVIPHLGDVKLPALKAEHVEEWHGKLLAGGLSPRTVLHAHRVLNTALNRAVKYNTLARNVAASVKPPKVEDKEIEIVPSDTISVLFDGLRDHALYPIACLALATGMRRGELLGLQWGDVDLDRAVLRVERSVEETKAGLRMKEPKTKRSRRNIGVPQDAVTMLRNHKVAQLELRLRLGLGNIAPQTLVFSTIEGELLSPDNLSRDWIRVCKLRKLARYGFHALRHTHVSILIRQGMDILTISRRIGHSKPSVTLDVYGHLIEGADADAARH
jgi:integrase